MKIVRNSEENGVANIIESIGDVKILSNERNVDFSVFITLLFRIIDFRSTFSENAYSFLEKSPRSDVEDLQMRFQIRNR